MAAQRDLLEYAARELAKVLVRAPSLGGRGRGVNRDLSKCGRASDIERGRS